jgi:hypothetical protein
MTFDSQGVSPAPVKCLLQLPTPSLTQAAFSTSPGFWIPLVTVLSLLPYPLCNHQELVSDDEVHISLLICYHSIPLPLSFLFPDFALT